MIDRTETNPTIEEMLAAIPLSVKVNVWVERLAPYMFACVCVNLGILTYIVAPKFGFESIRNHGFALIFAPLYVLIALYFHVRLSDWIHANPAGLIPVVVRLRIRKWMVLNHIAWACLNSVLLGLFVFGTFGYLEDLVVRILLGAGVLGYVIAYGVGVFAIGVGRNLLEDDVGFVLQLQEWAKEANVKPA